MGGHETACHPLMAPPAGARSRAGVAPGTALGVERRMPSGSPGMVPSSTVRLGFRRSKSNDRNGRLAEWTGLEPATPGVTGRYSNQLNYHSEEAWYVSSILVGAEGFEPPTFAL